MSESDKFRDSVVEDLKAIGAEDVKVEVDSNDPSLFHFTYNYRLPKVCVDLIIPTAEIIKAHQSE